jgi:hypothetical protein
LVMVTEESIKQFSTQCENIFTQIRRDVIGQNEVVEGTIIAMIAGGNVLLEGVPGVGKTRLVRTLGRVFSLPFSRIQFTPVAVLRQRPPLPTVRLQKDLPNADLAQQGRNVSDFCRSFLRKRQSRPQRGQNYAQLGRATLFSRRGRCGAQPRLFRRRSRRRNFQIAVPSQPQ